MQVAARLAQCAGKQDLCIQPFGAASQVSGGVREQVFDRGPLSGYACIPKHSVLFISRGELVGLVLGHQWFDGQVEVAGEKLVKLVYR